LGKKTGTPPEFRVERRFERSGEPVANEEGAATGFRRIVEKNEV